MEITIIGLGFRVMLVQFFQIFLEVWFVRT